MAEIVVCPSAAKLLQSISTKVSGVRPDAFTIGGAVFYLSPPTDPTEMERLRKHEHKHIEQQAALAPWWAKWLPLTWRAWAGLPAFAPKYIDEHLKHGYQLNKYEAEARAAEA